MRVVPRGDGQRIAHLEAADRVAALRVQVLGADRMTCRVPGDERGLRSPSGTAPEREVILPMESIRIEPQEAKVGAKDEVLSQIVRIWEDLLGVKPVRPDDNFFDLGGDSSLAVEFLAKTRKIWRKNLPLSSLFEAPTVEQMAALVRGKNLPEASPRVAAIKPEGSRPPFLCVDAGPFFRRLAQRIHPEQPFFGLRLLDTDSLPVQFTLADIAAYHLRTILEIQPEGPYYLGGWSASGLVAHQVAEQLRSRGQVVACLVLFDVPNATAVRKPTKKNKALVRKWFSHFAWKLQRHLANLRSLKTSEKWDYLQALWKQIYLDFSRRLWLVGYRLQQRSRWQLPIAPRDPSKAVFVASYQYFPKPFSGRVVLFRASVQSTGPDTDYRLGWGDLLGGNLKICEMPGDHDDMFLEPHVELLAKELNRFLSEAAATQQLAVLPAGANQL